MGKLAVFVAIVFLGIFFGLPIVSGVASIPKTISPQEIGSFLGSFLRYWLQATSYILQKSGLT